MLDLITPEWAETLIPGDVVLFEFPVAAASHGAVKSRPCLVFDLRIVGGSTFVELAYGTTRYSRSNRGYEVRINHPDDYVAAGLRHPTRFIGARRIIVHPSHPGFTRAQEGTARIGRLSPPLLERLDGVGQKSGKAMLEGWRRQPHVDDLSDVQATVMSISA